MDHKCMLWYAKNTAGQNLTYVCAAKTHTFHTLSLNFIPEIQKKWHVPIKNASPNII